MPALTFCRPDQDWGLTLMADFTPTRMAGKTSCGRDRC